MTCNREGAKHTNFPILGERVTEPSWLNNELDLNQFNAAARPLLDEIPYLLHPEVDDPWQYLAFEVCNSFVRIKGIDKQGRGQRTIEICKLNRKEILEDRHERVISDFIQSIDAAFIKYQNNDSKLLDQLEFMIELFIQQANNPLKTHTFLRQYIIKNPKNFASIMTPWLKQNQRTLVIQIFDWLINH